MPRISADERRELLVRAALSVIAREGVAGATTRAIVAEAGMSLASFHYAFRSHDEMMSQLVRHVVDAEEVSVFAALRPGRTIEQSLHDGLNAFLEHIIEDPARELVLQELLQYALRTHGLEPLARNQYETYTAAVTAVLVEGAAAAGVEWDRPVVEVARLVLTITDGITLAWLVDRDAAAARRVIDFAAPALAALALPTRTAARADTPTSASPSSPALTSKGAGA